MPYAIDVSWVTERTSRAPEDGQEELRRMVERIKRDHATMRALADDVERACRDVEERRPGSVDRFRRAVWALSVAFDEHLAAEEAYFAPILRTSDAWGDMRVLKMTVEHNEQRRIILELVESADRVGVRPDALVAQARALVVSFRNDMDAEERSLDDAGIVSRVVLDQEDG